MPDYPSPPAAQPNIKQVEVDMGAVPILQQTFTITDAAVSPSSRIVGTVANEAPTGKELDEMEMDTLDLKFTPESGQFKVLVTGGNGYLEGKFKINYLVG